ncbi:MAG: hypothetical protein RR585_10595 [Coprobacillus sp.]
MKQYLMIHKTNKMAGINAVYKALIPAILSMVGIKILNTLPIANVEFSF